MISFFDSFATEVYQQAMDINQNGQSSWIGMLKIWIDHNLDNR